MLSFIHQEKILDSELTLCPSNCAVLWRRQQANYLKFWTLAEATGREGTRAPERKSLLKMTQNDGSGSRLSTDGISHEQKDIIKWVRDTDPSGYLNTRYYGTRWRHYACKACGYRHGDAKSLLDDSGLFHP